MYIVGDVTLFECENNWGIGRDATGPELRPASSNFTFPSKIMAKSCFLDSSHTREFLRKGDADFKRWQDGSWGCGLGRI